jgi:DNA-directed RNA polymerase beta' subunit
MTNKETNDKIIKIITEKKEKVRGIIDKIHLNIFENNSGLTNKEEFEMQINNTLNEASTEAGKTATDNLQKYNGFVEMVKCGSKGSELNIASMMSCLGQQNVDGKRIPYGFDNRTLPCYKKYDDSPSARGFVESSYVNGLKPEELFFHAIAGRMGLIDTAVKTATTGYIQRKLIKGMEDLMVNYDMTIRNNKNKIIQFRYGEDGFDTVKLENQQLKIIMTSIEDLYLHYDVPSDFSGKLNLIFVKSILSKYKKDIGEYKARSKKYIEMFIENRKSLSENVFKNKKDKDDFVKCPVAFSYIITNMMSNYKLNANSFVDLTLLDALEMIEYNYSKLEKLNYSAPNLLFKLLYYYHLSPKDLLINKRFNRIALTMLLDTIILQYKKAIVAPGEMVGMIAAQSIGEQTTQQTLNSVTYETEILVRNENKKINKYQIGDFVNKFIKKVDQSTIQYYEKTDTTYAPMEEYYEIPSCNEDGIVEWKQIEAVTKHPVINLDGTNVMLKITTEHEREVIATKAKSFLMLQDGKITEINGDKLKVGDYLPVCKKPIDYEETRFLNLKEILPPNEYVYTSEVEKAKAVMGGYRWWVDNANKTFILPYKDSWTFKNKMDLGNTVFVKDCVYRLQTKGNRYQIPEMLELDYNFGYFVGAYCAEGCITKHQVSISNNIMEYFEPIKELCKKLNIGSKVNTETNKEGKGWTSQEIRVYSTILANMMEILGGKLSHNKFVSELITFSNKECILGFLDAYIAGDGSVDQRQKAIICGSTSKTMLLDISQMLSYLGIYSYIKKHTLQKSNNRGSLDIKQMYDLNIRGRQAQKLAAMLNMKFPEKQAKLQALLKHKYLYDIGKFDIIIPNKVNDNIIIEKRNGRYNDTLFDKIKKIEIVNNTTPYAYDLTVADTRNFNLYSQLCGRDTFHLAGNSTKSNVTRGVPRIEEILSLNETIKNPSMTIYMKSEDDTDVEKIHDIMNNIEYTQLRDIVEYSEIILDPDDLNTKVIDDKDLMEQYKEFNNMIGECLNDTNIMNTNTSKFIMRIKMNTEAMLDKNITMDDVYFVLKNAYQEDISCLFSDYNADNLIFRIRLNLNSIKKNKKSLDKMDEIYLFKTFQEKILYTTILRGIKNINKVVLMKIDAINNVVEVNNTFTEKKIYVLDTIGSNLLDILGLDFIDYKKTITNNIVEVYNILGIEAARETIYKEFADVIESNGQIDFHTLSLLCDRMCYTGNLMSINRHGINNDNIGPIAKASFEETPLMFLKAAKHGELDIMKGISANVMCGQKGAFGTNVCSILMNIAELKQEIKPEPQTQVDINKVFDEYKIEPDDKCSIQNLEIQNNVQNIQKTDLGKLDDKYELW